VVRRQKTAFFDGVGVTAGIRRASKPERRGVAIHSAAQPSPAPRVHPDRNGRPTVANQKQANQPNPIMKMKSTWIALATLAAATFTASAQEGERPQRGPRQL